MKHAFKLIVLAILFSTNCFAETVSISCKGDWPKYNNEIKFTNIDLNKLIIQTAKPYHSAYLEYIPEIYINGELSGISFYDVPKDPPYSDSVYEMDFPHYQIGDFRIEMCDNSTDDVGLPSVSVGQISWSDPSDGGGGITAIRKRQSRLPEHKGQCSIPDIEKLKKALNHSCDGWQFVPYEKIVPYAVQNNDTKVTIYIPGAKRMRLLFKFVRASYGWDEPHEITVESTGGKIFDIMAYSDKPFYNQKSHSVQTDTLVVRAQGKQYGFHLLGAYVVR